MALEREKGQKRLVQIGISRNIRIDVFYKPVLDIILGVCTLSFQSFMLEVSSFVLEVSSLEPNRFCSGQHPLLSVSLDFFFKITNHI